MDRNLWQPLSPEEQLEACVLRFKNWGHAPASVAPDLEVLFHRFQTENRRELQAATAWVLFHVNAMLGRAEETVEWAEAAYKAAQPDGKVAITYRMINGQLARPAALEFNIEELQSNLLALADEYSKAGWKDDGQKFRDVASAMCPQIRTVPMPSSRSKPTWFRLVEWIKSIGH